MFGDQVFEVDWGLIPVTSKSGSHSTELIGREVTIIDTPGFCEDGKDAEENLVELGKAISFARNGVHAIAVVVNVSDRFTSSQVAFLKEIELFDEFWPYTFIIFSRAKICGTTEEQQRKYILETYKNPKCPDHLKTLLDRVEKRFIVLESSENNQDYRKRKIKEFFDMVDRIYTTNKRLYSNRLFK